MLEKGPYSELFWSVFCRIRIEYGEILPHSVRMRENTEQENSELGHFTQWLRSRRSIQNFVSVIETNNSLDIIAA